MHRSSLPLDTDRGVSPVVGVAILLGVLLVLAAVLFGVTSGFNLNNTPEVAGVQFSADGTSGTVDSRLLSVANDDTDRVVLEADGKKKATLTDIGEEASFTAPSDDTRIVIVAVDEEDGNNRSVIGSYDPDIEGGTQVDFSQSDGDLSATLTNSRSNTDNVTVEWEEGGSTQTETISNEGETITISDADISNDTTVTVTEQPSGTVVTEYTYTTDGSTDSFSTAHTSAPNCGEVNITDDDSNGYYDIDSDYKLQCIQDFGLSENYELTQNIDASGTSEWNGGSSAVAGDAAAASTDAKGFDPIGDFTAGFEGELKGRDYTIKGMYINRPNQSAIGLFASADSGSIENVELQNVDIQGDANTAGLVGLARGTAIIRDSRATGSVDGGTDGGSAGLLVGRNNGNVENSYATGDVAGDTKVGILVGNNYGSIDSSYATGDVSGNAGIGGLVGLNEGDITNSNATANITGGEIGGLVGRSAGNIDNSYAAGNVTGSSNAGGLVGFSNGGSVENSYSTATVTGTQKVGGLVGDNRGDIANSYSTGDVTGTERVGGLVGSGDGNVQVYDSYATGDVTGADGGSGVRQFGGVAGIIEGGGSYSNVTTSSSVDITGSSDNARVGGFAGEVGKVDIESSSATGSVASDTGSFSTGGFVGAIGDNTTIDNSYTTVSLDANAGEVGGFVGSIGFQNSPSINNSYSRVDVDAAGSDEAGGFYGTVGSDATPSFRDVYAVGSVNGGTTGGFGGDSRGSPSYTDAYWDTDVASGQSSDVSGGDKSGITALSSSEMKGSSAESNMNFDFTNVWKTVTDDYPELQAQS